MTDYSHETFVINNPDGSISLDAYAGKSREDLKSQCREFCRAIDEWQMIAMVIAEHGTDGLSPEDKARLDNLIEAYRD